MPNPIVYRVTNHDTVDHFFPGPDVTILAGTHQDFTPDEFGNPASYADLDLFISGKFEVKTILTGVAESEMETGKEILAGFVNIPGPGVDHIDITFTDEFPSLNYSFVAIPPLQTSVSYSNKTTTGITINFGSSTTFGQVMWIAIQF